MHDMQQQNDTTERTFKNLWRIFMEVQTEDKKKVQRSKSKDVKKKKTYSDRKKWNEDKKNNDQGVLESVI